MADYVIDWATANIDEEDGVGSGVNVITGSGDPVTVTVSTPDNASTDGEFVYHSGIDGLLSFYPAAGTSTEVQIDFTDGVGDPYEVSNVTFNLLDVDQEGDNSSSGDWDDVVEIFAYDIDGVRLDVTFSGVTTQTTTAYTIEGETVSAGAVPVGVTIIGDVATLRIVYTNGPDDSNAGWVGIGDISFDEAIPDCFVRGTMIETDRGEIAIEALSTGDLVRTADNGFQPIHWIGSISVKAKGSKAPILFRKGAIGNTRDLLLSPAHRVVLNAWQAEVLFGTGELLASAKSLVNDSTIVRQVADDRVEYFHILFENHEIVFSNGAATESYHPGNAVEAGTMAQEARNEIFSLFPELEHNPGSYGPSARETLRPHEAALLNL